MVCLPVLFDTCQLPTALESEITVAVFMVIVHIVTLTSSYKLTVLVLVLVQ